MRGSLRVLSSLAAVSLSRTKRPYIGSSEHLFPVLYIELAAVTPDIPVECWCPPSAASLHPPPPSSQLLPFTSFIHFSTLVQILFAREDMATTDQHTMLAPTLSLWPLFTAMVPPLGWAQIGDKKPYLVSDPRFPPNFPFRNHANDALVFTFHGPC